MSALPFEFLLPEQLVVNGFATRGPMCMVLDYENLWVPSNTFENRVAGGVAGSVAEPGIQDQLQTSLPFWITGTHDWEGTAYPDPRTGFRRNWRYLNATLFLPPATATYNATYTSADADEDPIPFAIQVVKPTISERSPVMWVGQVEVILPGGAL